ncbi:MAG: hypothetical protein QOH66_1156 [Actinomycetota bacterium]|nr:hypothetical protein [Actinomycetota bacterium]
MSEQRGNHPDDMVDAYLRHVLEGGEAPDLAGLGEQERAELQRTFTLLDAIAGIDADLVPPLEDDPVARALGFTPVEAAAPAAAVRREDARRRITRDIERMNRGAVVLADEEAAELPDAPSDLLVRVAGVRIRVMIVGPDELSHPGELLREADRLFYRFPETAAVALVADDDDLSCLLVEAQDCRPAVETPTGMRIGPRPRRPRLPLPAALASYLDEIEPVWEEPGTIIDAESDFDVAVLAAETATAVVRRLKDEASRARIPAKAFAFAALGEEEVEELAKLVMDVARGHLAADDIGERISQITTEAA